MPAHLRDAQIVELRRSGWMLAEIAGEVGLSSKAAVSQAITRIATELEKPARTRRRDGRSEEW